MQRFFGKKKATVPGPSLDDASAKMDDRGGELEKKVHKLDVQLQAYKQQLQKARTVGAKNLLKQKAMRVLKQKHMYEKQLESLQNQQFNIDQTRLTQQNMQDSVTMVTAMKQANKDLKVAYKQIDIDDVEELHEDMSDLLADADEINEVLGQTYGVPDDIDETDLMNELDALDDEIELDDTDAVPEYLQQANEAPSAPNISETETNDVDELGLPKQQRVNAQDTT